LTKAVAEVTSLEIISMIAQSVVIAGFLTGAFSYIVLTPLNKSIESLRTIVQEMKDELRYSEQRRHELQERVAKVEASAASAHHRIDRLDNLVGGAH
jgi:septal ring factor EnvC (AmiA/AmiB activator)